MKSKIHKFFIIISGIAALLTSLLLVVTWKPSFIYEIGQGTNSTFVDVAELDSNEDYRIKVSIKISRSKKPPEKLPIRLQSYNSFNQAILKSPTLSHPQPYLDLILIYAHSNDAGYHEYFSEQDVKIVFWAFQLPRLHKPKKYIKYVYAPNHGSIKVLDRREGLRN